MEDSKNYGHQHPLALLKEDQQLIMDNQSGLVADCSRCGEKVSAPCFSCVNDCGFHLHEVCADVPLELNHPLHHDHPLLLKHIKPSSCICDFCDKDGNKVIYRCSSCDLDFHIKCALFTLDVVQHNLKELEHVGLEDPLISTKKDDEELGDVTNCFWCWKPLANYAYFALDSGFSMHKNVLSFLLK
ncbi:uncharacterized protein LOC120218560 [Hibiscus syriacus]|uniref:uncharacterized protein LOC120218560 n=1 Tax=Hibiscus syriacus TaxID=106335 RepID=UPI001922492D|nr:uncharacterized protein LOC120218560 [Hibiscus syriacus]